MKARHIQTLAGIGLALGGTVAAPSVASAQMNRVPDPNATRVMVAVFKTAEKGLGVQAADAIRSRINSEFPFKQVYVLPKQDINATLEASGFPTAEALAPHDAKALANLLRADEYITGTVTKTPTGVKVDAFLVLARDNTLMQPLGSFEAGNVGGVSGLISKELKEARKQLDAEKKCTNAGRESKWDAAVAAAKEGIAAYPKATLARICLATAMAEMKAPAAERMAIAKEIVALHPTSNRGLGLLADAYREANMQDSSVVTLTRLLSTDPSNPRLQKLVVEAVASLANPRIARPIVDTAVALNPGDPELLRLRWLILYAVRDFKEMHEQGEELIRLDTAFADTTYFIRTSVAYGADSQAQKAAEVASRGLQKFPNQPTLLYQQIYSLSQAGQSQQALDALDKALAAKVAVENATALRIQLLRALNRGAEALPAVRAAIAAGDTSSTLPLIVLQAANDQYKAARATPTVESYTAAITALAYADSVAKGEEKGQASFLLGAAHVDLGRILLKQATDQKSCQPAKDAKGHFVDAQILLPRGGAAFKDAMGQYMGQVMQLDPYADQLIKAYCK